MEANEMTNSTFRGDTITNVVTGNTFAHYLGLPHENLTEFEISDGVTCINIDMRSGAAISFGGNKAALIIRDEFLIIKGPLREKKVMSSGSGIISMIYFDDFLSIFNQYDVIPRSFEIPTVEQLIRSEGLKISFEWAYESDYFEWLLKK